MLNTKDVKRKNEIVKVRIEGNETNNLWYNVKFREQFAGETCEVLLENTEPLSGRSERYFMVFLAPSTKKYKKNDLLTVKIVGNGKDGVLAEVKYFGF